LFADKFVYGPFAHELTERVFSYLKENEPELVVLSRGYLKKIPPKHPIYDWIIKSYEPIPGQEDTRFYSLRMKKDGDLKKRLEMKAKI